MAWDSSLPVGSTLISASDEILQQNFEAIERGNVTSARKVRVDSRDALALASDPTNVADVGYVYAKDVNSNAELHYIDEAGAVTQITDNGALASGVVQFVETSDSNNWDISAIIPVDGTVPQNTEGFEVITQSITPKSATSKLIIEYDASYAITNSNNAGTIALFQDSTANASAVSLFATQNTAGNRTILSLRHVMTSGTTSSTTFKIRIGTSANNVYLLRAPSGTQVYGGTELQRLTITEII
jgi:hypothetical protein